MSRLKDALMALLGKCTPEGTKPVGNNTDEILECIARHYVGKPYITMLTWNDDASAITSDRGYKEVYEAFIAGRQVYAFDNLGFVWTPWCMGKNFAQFMCQRSGQNNVVKLREKAGECDLVRTNFGTV